MKRNHIKKYKNYYLATLFVVVLVLLSSLGYLATFVLIPLYKDAKTLVEIKKEKRLREIIEKRKNPTPFKIDGIK